MWTVMGVLWAAWACVLADDASIVQVPENLTSKGGTRSSDPNVQIVDLPLLDPNSLPEVPLGNPDTIENDIPGPPLSPEDFETSQQMNHAAVDTSNQADPIELAGLYQGDIILNSQDIIMDPSVGDGRSPVVNRNAMIDMNRRWPNGVIPYVISSSYNKQERGTIAMAIAEYHKTTCLRLVPRTIERDYIHILKGDGCSSSVGRVGGAQTVSLGPGCIYAGIVMHELMHVSGFWHEQSRPDRDNYITINKLNVQAGMWYNFEKYSWDKIQSLGVGYDLGSVMHYGPYAFAKDRTRPTIIPRETGVEIGQRRSFSEKDIMKLQKMYNCANTTVSAISTPPPLVSTEPETCEDTSEHCQTWAELGECKENPAWMAVNCKKACLQCGKECRDDDEFCAFWAEEGECISNSPYMTLVCKLSCGLCAVEEDLNPKCEDKHRYCQSWEASGQCQANPTYMHLFCKKSCKQC